MIKLFYTFFIAVFLSSCASVVELREEFLPLQSRLVSPNSAINQAAVKELLAMDENSRKKADQDMIEAFGSEEDPYRRGRMLETLREQNAGTYTVIPLIKAAVKNTSIRDYKEIIAYLTAVKPGSLDIRELQEMLKTGAWEIRMLAMTSLASLSKKAGIVMPELMAMRKDFGADAGKYSRIFDCMAMINPQIAVTSVIADAGGPNGQLRMNAVLKLAELQEYLGDKLPEKKEIIPALIRALYSGDKALSATAAEALSKIEDPEARQAAESYLKMGRTLLNMLYKFAGTTAEEAFKKQEQAVDEKIQDYYRSIGREDAVR